MTIVEIDPQALANAEIAYEQHGDIMTLTWGTEKHARVVTAYVVDGALSLFPERSSDHRALIAKL